MKKALLLSLSIVLTLQLQAQNLLTFAFEGKLISGTGVPNLIPSNFNDAGISSSTIGRTGLGISAFGGETMNCNGISIGTTEPVLTSYIEFRVTPLAGKIVTITGAQFAMIRSNGTGATGIVIRSSVDGFTSNLGGAINFANTNGNTFMVANQSFNLSNITSQVIFRIYPFGGIQSFGTWGIGGRTGDDLIVFGSSTDAVLPIDLVKFEAEKIKEKVKLVWLTASEFNNDKFILEKSLDAKNFEAIAEIEGAGTSKELNTYELIDHEPYSGTSYYRLTQVDLNGKSTSFEPISVNMKSGVLSLELGALSEEQGAGSGGQDLLPWKIYSPEDVMGVLIVYDMNGKEIFRDEIKLTQGYQQYNMPLVELNNGMHIASLMVGKEIVRKKVKLN